ncbi:ABC transporter ATP-binding protein (plasmid) [Pseudonocardia bannensis]|uniref:ABC transporter ATP-binding protein n=1 Tax=Pseudonocardia bannensis TaxID=630973 RepID=A0A848DQY1_9PSEU|nr:ABC transporter ATP-binding protein [Pseudonocardia bannensis]NMH94923.1 ABC transporter ATP-binding protein [Pseudonocardia bannensis]
MGTVALRLTGAEKAYGDRPVLAGLDLEVRRDERLVILGPSGSGKSTLLRVLAGLEPLDAGTVEQPDGAVRATVFQQPLLLPWLDVEANVRLGGRYRANRGRYSDERASELLELFGLAPLAKSRPAQLSGGQAQRVAIARAMAVGADVLLLDEPFSALDPATRIDLQAWLRDAATRLGLTLVLVTHDVDEALYLATTVTALDGTGGRAGTWPVGAAPEHDELATHPLRAELVASYRSQLAGTS